MTHLHVSLIDTDTHEITRYVVARKDEESSEQAAERVLEFESESQGKTFLVEGITRGDA